MPYSQPTLEISGFSLIEQCDPLQENQLSEHSMPSGEINLSDIPQEKKALAASLEGRSDTSSGFESDLTLTYNSKSTSDYIPAADLQVYNRLLCRLQWSSIEGSNGAGCPQTNSNQPSKEGNVTRKEKPFRPRNFNLVHLQRLMVYLA